MGASQITHGLKSVGFGISMIYGIVVFMLIAAALTHLFDRYALRLGNS
jgi:hypothetical protein